MTFCGGLHYNIRTQERGTVMGKIGEERGTVIGKIGEERLVELLFAAFLIMGIAARVWRLGQVPDGMNQDEAFAAYEAYSLLRTGLDTSGYPFPVYLTAWGSGMNALESYLMIPFIALFGLEAWAVRMPQMIVGVLSLIAAYDVLKRTAGRWAGLCGMFLMAVCPWHIMLSRWALESNLAPGFLLFGLCFFLRGMEDHRFFLLSALMYGLSLYCYAAIWPFVPLALLLQAGFALRCGQLRFRGRDGLWIGLSVLTLFLLALPLMLFLLVNWGVLHEIRLPFLSIPRLLVMRSGEFSPSGFRKNAAHVLDILLQQRDGLIWNTPKGFGLFYYGTLPFFFVGVCRAFWELFMVLRDGKPRTLGLLAIPLFTALFQCLCLANANVNRMNNLWPMVVLLAAVGMWTLCARPGHHALLAPLVLYAALFIRFETYYFNNYVQESQWAFFYGLEDAVDIAVAREGEIQVSPSANYVCVLFFSAHDPDEYRSTVVYTNYPNAFLAVERYGRFRFSNDTSSPDPACAYILDRSADRAPLEAAGFTVEQYGYYWVAYHE